MRDRIQGLIYLGLLLLFTSGLPVANAATSASSQITLVATPPPGFEDLDGPVTNFIDVYYGDELITTAEATFNDDSIRFRDPQKIVALIPVVRPESVALVARALQGTLPAHPNPRCLPRQRSAQCRILRPAVAGVIFDHAHFRATLFINKVHLMSRTRRRRYLPPADVGFSLLHNLQARVSGSRNGRYDSLYNQDVLSYKDQQMVLYSLYHRLTSSHANTADNAHQFHISQWYWAKHRAGRYYELGMLDTHGGAFLTGQRILGVQLGHSPYTLLNAKQLTGMPLEVFMPTAGEVSIYKADQLLTKVSLPAGRHPLDTQNFPQGSYDITLVISDHSGNELSKRSQLYTKTHFPARGHAEQFYSLGVLPQRASFADHRLLPRYDHTPFVELVDSRSLGAHFGLTSSLASTGRRSYWEESLAYLHAAFSLESDLLLGSHDDYGIGFTGRYSPTSKLHLDLSTRKLWAKQAAILTDNGVDLHTPYDPLTYDHASVGAHISYYWQRANLRLGYRRNHYADSDSNEQYTIDYRYRLLQRPRFRITLALDLEHQNHRGFSSLANLEFRSRSARSTQRLELDYRHEQATSLNHKQSGIEASFSHQVKIKPSADSQLDLQARFTKPLHSHHAQLTANLLTPSARFDAYGGYDRSHYPATSQASSSVYYNLGLNTNLLLTPKGMDIQRGNWRQAAILVQVNGPATEPSKVLVNGRLLGKVFGQASETFFLTPYRQYHIELVPEQLGQTFKATHSPQEVTLYQGNIKTLYFDLQEEITLFAHIIDSKQQALTQAKLTALSALTHLPQHTVALMEKTPLRNSYHRTDTAGFIELAISKQTRVLHFTDQTGKHCTVHLPQEKMKAAKTYLYLDRLLCR